MSLGEAIISGGQVLLCTQTLRVAADPLTRVSKWKARITCAGLWMMVAGMALSGLYWASCLTVMSASSWAFISVRRQA